MHSVRVRAICFLLATCLVITSCLPAVVVEQGGTLALVGIAGALDGPLPFADAAAFIFVGGVALYAVYEGAHSQAEVIVPSLTSLSEAIHWVQAKVFGEEGVVDAQTESQTARGRRIKVAVLSGNHDVGINLLSTISTLVTAGTVVWSANCKLFVSTMKADPNYRFDLYLLETGYTPTHNSTTCYEGIVANHPGANILGLALQGLSAEEATTWEQIRGSGRFIQIADSTDELIELVKAVIQGL